MAPTSSLAMELDLESFAGPFDLLLALVLRDALDLGEVPVADVCLTYLAEIDAAGRSTSRARASSSCWSRRSWS